MDEFKGYSNSDMRIWSMDFDFYKSGSLYHIEFCRNYYLMWGEQYCLWNIWKTKKMVFPWKHMELVYWEEVIFFVVFLLWTYMAGFHPAAHGTEKYMDFWFYEVYDA